MSKPTDVRPKDTTLYFLPVETRVPLKFGSETLTEITCARVCMRIEGAKGKTAEGWGETPLSVQWVWPSSLSYAERHEALKDFCVRLCGEWDAESTSGHPVEIGHTFISKRLPNL
ncbi:unnamed protein product, partial [marine sediment metagenome]